VILIHEWWGLNDNIETMARRFAEQGYVALAVDLYGGEVADDPERARELTQSVEEGPALDNLRQARRYLAEEQRSPRVGVVGWCFGGAWSLQTALAEPDQLDAAVVYYGRLVTERDRLSELDTPLLGIFGGEDSSIPVDDVRRFESTLEELGKDAEIHLYEGAGHAFANPSGERYVPEAAEDAWEKTLVFLAEHLKS
jgi:carboxymethylenebutenolidase